MKNDNACKEDMMIVTEQSIVERCNSFYTTDEKASLLKVGSKIADYECFLQKFEQWCSKYISI